MTTIKPGQWQLPMILVLALLSACATTPAPSAAPGESDASTLQYDMNSWKSMITSDCRAFFDGCNNCLREPGKAAACTRKACAVYRQPRCLDDTAATQSVDPLAAGRVDYACEGGNRFSVYYGEYPQDDQTLRLGNDAVMFSDDQAGEVYQLQRERSASGEKYANASGLQFFAKGNEALVMLQDERLYSNCARRP